MHKALFGWFVHNLLTILYDILVESHSSFFRSPFGSPLRLVLVSWGTYNFYECSCTWTLARLPFPFHETYLLRVILIIKSWSKVFPFSFKLTLWISSSSKSRITNLDFTIRLFSSSWLSPSLALTFSFPFLTLLYAPDNFDYLGDYIPLLC